MSDEDQGFPDMIEGLPEADIPFPGVRGWISQGKDHQIGFFDIEPTAKIPEHSHKAQWGIVVRGQMRLTIGGSTNTYTEGGSYYIPNGVVHSAVFKSRTLVLDFFTDRHRYRTKG